VFVTAISLSARAGDAGDAGVVFIDVEDHCGGLAPGAACSKLTGHSMEQSTQLMVGAIDPKLRVGFLLTPRFTLTAFGLRRCAATCCRRG
jgi:hypothetical protein